MRRQIMLATLLGACVVAATTAGRAAEPSAGCAGGSPVVVHTDATPGGGDALVCNDGSKVPAPANGTLSVHIDSTTKSGYADFDGDPRNNTKSCTDGFARVMVDGSGPHFYEAPDGNYADTDPKKTGKQQAKEEAPADWAGNSKTNCSA